MQLPLVILIVLLCFKMRLPGNKFTQSKNKKNNIRSKEEYPIKFIALSLIFNIIYLLLNINDNNHLIETSTNFNQISIFLFDLLTTLSFFLGLTYWYTKRKNFKQKLFILICIIIVTGLILINNIQIRPSFMIYDKLDFSLYNFLGYFLVSAYLYSKIKISDSEFESLTSRYFVSLGFLIWAFLQIFGRIGNLIGLDDINIQLMGFTISTISKISILFGIFNFYFFLARYAIFKQQKQNEQLQAKIKVIHRLQNLINSVSISNNSKDLVRKVVIHLTNEPVFGYEYAIFSKVDLFKRKIFYQDSECLNKEQIINVEKWMPKNGIPFESRNIIARAVREKKVIHVIGDIVDGKRINLNKLSPLDKKVFIKYKQENLERYFIPVLVVYDNKTNIEKSEAVALIEVGFFRSKLDFREGHILKEITGELQIYLDNCSQGYNRLIRNEIDQKIEISLQECDVQSKDDHFEYLKRIINLLCEFIEANFGIISINPLINGHKEFNESLIPYNFKDNDWKKIQKMYNSKFIECESNDQNNNLINNEFKNKIVELINAKSYKSFPIMFKNVTFGYINIFGQNYNFFNNTVEFVIIKMASRIAPTYNEKRFHKFVAEAAIPNDILQNPETNISHVIKLLQNYFNTIYISVNLIDKTSETKDAGIQIYLSEGMEKFCKDNYSKNYINEAIDLNRDYQLIKLNTEEINGENKLFWEFGRKNKLLTLLNKPLRSNNQFYGFINIFFKKELNELAYEDLNVLNLIATKSVMILQIHRMIDDFRIISDSFTKDELKSTLQTITRRAMQLLNSDSVILFKSKDGVNVVFEDVTYCLKDKFKDDRLIEVFQKDKNKHVELAELIIQDQSKYFERSKEYYEFVKKRGKKYERSYFKSDFWDREEIKSMAAIRLKKIIGEKIRVVGVMFINFRNEVVFNKEIRSFIETFADFAAGCIETGYVFQRNRQYLLKNLRMCKPILTELLRSGLLHDANKKYNALNSMFFELIKKIDNPGYKKRLSAMDIRGGLGNLEKPMIDLFDAFEKIKKYYKADDEIHYETNIYIAKIVEDQLNLLRNEIDEKLIRVKDEYKKSPVMIDCDSGQIGHAVFNILNNACQALKKRGTLDVKITETADKKMVNISIIDNGKGIDKEIYSIILEPYVSDKVNGSGLGLAMSNLTVKRHGGRLTYSSKGKKTKFTIALPIKKSE